MPRTTPPPSAASRGLVLIPGSTPLNQEQKAFNALVKKIDARRARLAEWNDAIPRFKQKYVRDLLPLEEQTTDLQVQLAQSLDQAWGQKGVTKGERKKLSALIVDLAQQILAQREDAEIKALYNTHGHADFDAEDAAGQSDMKAMLKDMFGVELGDDVDLNSIDEVTQRMHQQFAQARDTAEAAAAAHAAARKPRKKSAREEAREAAREAEEKQISQSIREVYRKLASALHPDREPDPAERQRKTDLMQRANDAYQKGNLLDLLELQLQLEHLDEAHLATLGPERLKHYGKILKEQLAELEMEITLVEERFAAEFGLSPFERLQPNRIMAILRSAIAQSMYDIHTLQSDLGCAGADVKRFKAWLKTIEVSEERPDFGFPF